MRWPWRSAVGCPVHQRGAAAPDKMSPHRSMAVRPGIRGTEGRDCGERPPLCAFQQPADVFGERFGPVRLAGMTCVMIGLAVIVVPSRVRNVAA